MKKYLLYILACTCILSCKDKNKDGVSTYLGGQIINPKMDYVLLTHHDKRSDTIALNKYGGFEFQCESLQTNLYLIRHKELQYVFVEPGDSIMFRLNTVDFDESLAFSGRGAEKNNFLMYLFLMNEEEDKKLQEQYKLAPELFEAEILQSRNKLQSDLKDFITSENPSDTFITIATSNIDYNYFSKKELYLSSKQAANDTTALKFPREFFAYRDSIDLNNKLLKNYYTYYQFLNRYLDNIAYDEYRNEHAFDKESFVHQEKKLAMIERWITNKHLHDNLLTTNVKRYLAFEDDTQKERELVAMYKNLDHNEAHQKDVDSYAAHTAKLNAGNMIPNVTLVAANHKTLPLQKVSSSKTVFFFWTRESIKHYKEIHVRIAELRSKYPEYTFVGINMDEDYDAWKKTMISSGYNQANEYQFKNVSSAKNALFINSANKAMIVDKGGTILEGNSNLFNQNFESLLLGFLNKK